MNNIINIINRELYGKKRIYVTSEHKDAIQRLSGKQCLNKLDIEALKDLGFEIYNETQTNEANIILVLTKAGEPVAIKDIASRAGMGWNDTLQTLMSLSLDGVTELLPDRMFRLKAGGEAEEEFNDDGFEKMHEERELREAEENTGNITPSSDGQEKNK